MLAMRTIIPQLLTSQIKTSKHLKYLPHKTCKKRLKPASCATKRSEKDLPGEILRANTEYFLSLNTTQIGQFQQ